MFTVNDFRDLVRLLDQHPDWRDELRRLVLTEEVLSLPATVRALVDAQLRTEARMDQLVEAQNRTEARMDQLTARMDQLAARMDQLTERMDQSTDRARMDQLTERMDQLTERMDQLTARMDQLTERMDQLTERMDQLTARMDQLAERMDQLTARVDQLTERMDQLTARMDQLTERMDQLTERMDQLAAALTKVSSDVDWLKGDQLERRYRERGPAYFAPMVRHAHVLSADEWVAMVEGALDQRQISEQEADSLLETDAVVRGRRREDGAEVYLVVEVSWGVGISDVQRAAERAATLVRIGETAIPVVAGFWVTPDAQEPARAMGVWQVANGRVTSPEAT